jgi:hypothetical protein
MGPLGIGNCRYYPLTIAAGTATICTGPSSYGSAYPVNYGPPAGLNPNGLNGVGCLYGFLTLAAGTSYAVTLYDVIQGAPSAPATLTTNTLVNGTGTAGQYIAAGPPGVGIRFVGSLVAVASGTPGAINVYWD